MKVTKLGSNLSLRRHEACIFCKGKAKSVSYPDAKETASETEGKGHDRDVGSEVAKAYRCEGSRVADVFDAVRFFNGREVLTPAEQNEE